MLQERQLILIVADVIHQFLNEPIGDLTAPDLHRTFYGRAQLVSLESRDEVLAIIHRLSQPTELGAVSDIIGPHC